MSIYYLVVFAMVLHAGADATPHCLIGSRVHSIMSGPRRSKVDVAAVLRMLRRQDVIVERPFIVINIVRRGIRPEEILGQLQHVIGIARLGTFGVVHKIVAG